VERALEAGGDYIYLQWLNKIVISTLSHGLYADSSIIYSRGYQKDQVGVSKPDLR
jgi:hypothetical protein